MSNHIDPKTVELSEIAKIIEASYSRDCKLINLTKLSNFVSSLSVDGKVTIGEDGDAFTDLHSSSVTLWPNYYAIRVTESDNEITAVLCAEKEEINMQEANKTMGPATNVIKAAMMGIHNSVESCVVRFSDTTPKINLSKLAEMYSDFEIHNGQVYADNGSVLTETADRNFFIELWPGTMYSVSIKMDLEDPKGEIILKINR